MKLLIDENIPHNLAVKLLNIYPQSTYVLNSSLRGKSDKEIFKYSMENKLIILTFDMDFADIITYPLRNSSRIILKLNQVNFKEMESIVIASLKKLKNKNLENSLIIITKNKIRIKRNVAL